MHDHLHRTKTRLLAQLQTKMGAVIATGGVQFDAEGHGFFIPEPGVEISMPAADGARIETVYGDVIPVQNLGVAASTSGLPRRYTFSHHGLP